MLLKPKPVLASWLQGSMQSVRVTNGWMLWIRLLRGISLQAWPSLPLLLTFLCDSCNCCSCLPIDLQLTCPASPWICSSDARICWSMPWILRHYYMYSSTHCRQKLCIKVMVSMLSLTIIDFSLAYWNALPCSGHDSFKLDNAGAPAAFAE